MPINVKKDQIFWFQRHNNPIISTVLWVLEAYLNGRHLHGMKLIKCKTDEEKRKSNKQLDIVTDTPEIINNITNNMNSSGVSANETKTATSPPSTSKCSPTTGDDLASLGRTNSSRAAATIANYNFQLKVHEESKETEYDTSVSPGWGFYVAITPEQQELFATTKKTSYRTSRFW